MEAGGCDHLFFDQRIHRHGKKSVMHEYTNDRVMDLSTITERHVNRELGGFNSWRHFVVHEDRAWLLNAMEKIQAQVAKIHESAENTQAYEDELEKLLKMFEDDRLNHLGDK